MVGQAISHYKILEKLGAGGMGVVYKAQDTKLDRIVALKFLPEHLTANEAEQARFLQEAKAASALNHQNVCWIHSIGEHEGQRFIDMEYVDGMTLRHRIAEGIKAGGYGFRVSEAIESAIQIGEALREAHSKGIVHRDIKCENIMLTSRNQIKVMDFGLAKLKGSLKLTRTSSTVGTLSSMAPEQLQGGDVDARSDIFSFGVVVYEMLTGKAPFRGEHEAAMMYSILNEQPAPMAGIRPEISGELDRIVRRALEKDPEDRYQHVDDMVSELRRLAKETTRVSRAQIAIPADQWSPAPHQSGSGVEVPVMTAAHKGRSLRKGVALTVAVAIVILAAVYFLFLRQGQTIDSLAVIPFVNDVADSTTEYLSDGMTESIINSLTRIPGLRVIPRSTVFRFKGKDIDPQEIGTRLNVRAVLTGRIAHRGGDLNLQLDLIDVARQSQIYGNQYQHRAADILAMQEEIVGDVVKKLGLSLSKEQEKTVNKRYTENVEAYTLYLQGRFHWNRRNALEIQRAIGFFNRAIALDPTYALARVGLADSYLIQEQYAGVPGREVFPKALEAATRALELDNSLAEAHTTVAFANAQMWNWGKAEQEFKVAFSLNPNYPTAYHWYSIMLHTLGRHEEAFQAIKRAEELDPLSLVIGLNVAISYVFQKDYRRAGEKFDALIAMDSTFSLTYYRKAQMYVELGKVQEAYALALKAVTVSGRSGEALSFLGYCSGMLGQRDEALKIAKELEHRYAEQSSTAYFIARVYAGVGDRDKAFKWLDTGLEDHSGEMTWLTQDQEWEQYRGDPRFVVLLQKTGLKK